MSQMEASGLTQDTLGGLSGNREVWTCLFRFTVIPISFSCASTITIAIVVGRSAIAVSKGFSWTGAGVRYAKYVTLLLCLAEL